MTVEFAPGVPVRVFLSYARQDGEFVEALALRLNRASEPRFEVLSDRRLLAGDDVNERLREWIEAAQVILLAVSPAYLDSAPAQREIGLAMARQTTGEAVVVPIILRESNWGDAAFGHLQALPPGAVPVSSWPKMQEAVDAIVSGLAEMVNARTAHANPERSNEKTSSWSLFGRGFRTLWFVASSYLLLGSLGFLGWYAAHPPVQGAGELQLSSSYELLVNSAVVGIAAMAVIQVARRLFRFRGAFHRQALSAWLPHDAMDELLARTRTGRTEDLFDLPTELLSGQLSAIAEQALEERERPSVLVLAMATEATGEPSQRRRESGGGQSAPDRRTLLAVGIQRNLDQFQIATAASWRRHLLLSAMLVSFTLFTLGLPIFRSASFLPPLRPASPRLEDWLANFGLLTVSAGLVGVFAGFLASIARDVVAIIEKLRR